MKKKISVFVVVSLIAAAFLVSCAKEPEKVRVAICPYTGDLPVFVALDKGYFEEQGLEIDAVTCGNSSEALNALLANKVDIIAPISFSALIAAEIESPGDFKLFLPGGETDKIVGSYLLVKKDSPISSLEELRGKKIGTYEGATQLLYLKLFLKEAGFNPEKDVTIIQVGTELQVASLDTGQFDALFTVEPYSTIALETGVAKILVENPRVKYIVNPFISGSAAVSTKFLDENPKAVRKFYKAIEDALDFIRENEDEARMILPEYTPLNEEIALKASLLEWYKVDENVDFVAIQKIADLLFENGILSKRVEMKEMFLDSSSLK